ncbi:MAG: sugar ABC transporter permease [Clostridia bacterium]|nr:sugar ABC transporter permease [Clostridia bacterium]
MEAVKELDTEQNEKPQKSKRQKRKWRKNNFEVLSMVVMGAIFTFFFGYLPMFGIVLAFKAESLNINVLDTMLHGAWAGKGGFENFYFLFTDVRFKDVLVNTVCYNLLHLAISSPAPVIMALIVSEIKHSKYAKTMQFFTFLPHFVSMVVYVGIIHSMTHMQTGVINDLLKRLNIIDKSINFKGDPDYAWGMMIVSGLIKGVGWGSIIYLAAIANVDVELYDAAAIDGVNRLQKTWYITLPVVANLFALQLVLALSRVLGNDMGTMLLWQTESNLSKTEVFSTFVYKEGIGNMFPMYSYATAAGFFSSIVGIFMLVVCNWVTKKIKGEGVIF